MLSQNTTRSIGIITYDNYRFFFLVPRTDGAAFPLPAPLLRLPFTSLRACFDARDGSIRIALVEGWNHTSLNSRTRGLLMFLLLRIFSRAICTSCWCRRYTLVAAFLGQSTAVTIASDQTRSLMQLALSLTRFTRWSSRLFMM